MAKLPLLIAGVAKISRESGIPAVSFSHAGNGNIHVNFLYDPANLAQFEAAPKALCDLFALVLQLGGTLSGEHRYWPGQTSVCQRCTGSWRVKFDARH